MSRGSAACKRSVPPPTGGTQTRGTGVGAVPRRPRSPHRDVGIRIRQPNPDTADGEAQRGGQAHVTWRPNPTERRAILDTWRDLSNQDTNVIAGLITAAAEPLQFTYTGRTLAFAGFNPCWAVKASFTAPATGTADLTAVAQALALAMPGGAMSLCKQFRFYGNIQHYHIAPPAVYRAFNVGRPDLYWLVASAWYCMTAIQTTYEQLDAQTTAVVDAAWTFDPGTKAWRDLVYVLKAGQIHAVQTGTGIIDLSVNGHPEGGVSIAPRDKMLATILLLWGASTNWLCALPSSAPPPLATFRDFIVQHTIH